MISGIQNEGAAMLRLEACSSSNQLRYELARLNQGARTVMESENSPRGILITYGSSGVVGILDQAGIMLKSYA